MSTAIRIDEHTGICWLVINTLCSSSGRFSKSSATTVSDDILNMCICHFVNLNLKTCTPAHFLIKKNGFSIHRYQRWHPRPDHRNRKHLDWSRQVRRWVHRRVRQQVRRRVRCESADKSTDLLICYVVEHVLLSVCGPPAGGDAPLDVALLQNVIDTSCTLGTPAVVDENGPSDDGKLAEDLCVILEPAKGPEVRNSFGEIVG